MRKRLTPTQKKAAILSALNSSGYPRSTDELGKIIGFASGKPLYEMLCELQQQGRVTYYTDTNNVGVVGYYWSITDWGRRMLEKFRSAGDASLLDNT